MAARRRTRPVSDEVRQKLAENLKSAREAKRTRNPTEKERRKPEDERKERHLRMRLTEDQWELFAQAAKISLLSVSAWARRELVSAARKVVASEGVP